MRQAFVISIFSFILSVCIAITYWIIRIGFLDNSIFIVLKVLGVSAFVLFLPGFYCHYTKLFSEALNKVFFNDTIISIYAIILIAFLGFVTPIIGVNISILFGVAGYTFLCLSIYWFVKQNTRWDKLALPALGIFFSLWISSVCWFMYLKPGILEGWLCGEYKIDTLFHLAIGQMVKTYGIPSTGLDGVPFMNYHWGSHWLFAQIANFLDLPVIVVYQLCFPVIIAPLLFRSFLSFIIQVKQLFRPEEDDRGLNFLFWIIFLSVFIGFIPNFLSGNSWAQFSSGGTGLYLFMLLSESYALSIILMLGILSTYLNFWVYQKKLTTLQQYIILGFILPTLLLILELVKISTWYVAGCLIGYFFLRLKLFSKRVWLVHIILVSLTILLISIVYDSKENHGSFEFLYFYRSKGISLPLFMVIFYIWTHIFIVTYIFKEKLYNTSFKSLLKSGKLLPIEAVLVISLGGLLPSIFLRIQSFDSLYFTEIQMWISSALVLTYIPFFKRDNIKYSWKKWSVLSISMIILFSIFFINTRTYWRSFYGENISIRKCLINNGNGNLLSDVKSAFINFKWGEIYPILEKHNQKIQSQYSKNKTLSFFQKLKTLDKIPLKEKRKSLVYVDFISLSKDSSYHWKLQCYNIAFIVPSLSGIAMVDGIDITYNCGDCCENNGYSYQYYPKWKGYGDLNSSENKLSYLCKRVKTLGFQNLIIYNTKTELFEKFICR